MRYADEHCEIKEQYNPHRYQVIGKCIKTGKPYTVVIPAEELFAYRQGKLIQVAMRSLSISDREFLMSGYSPEGWELTFGEDN